MRKFAKLGALPFFLLPVTLYPNPFHGHITLEGTDVANISIYNMLGERILEASDPAQVTLVNAPRGQYIMKITLANGQKLTKKALKW